MSRGLLGEEEDEEVSGSENEDSSFDEDMEALRRACLLTGTDMPATAAGTSTSDRDAFPDSDSEEDDLELVRSIQSRYKISPDMLKMLPLASSDGEEDDLETLRAIQRRFSAYGLDPSDKGWNVLSMISQESISRSGSEEEISRTALSDKHDSCRVFPESRDDPNDSSDSYNIKDTGPSSFLEYHPVNADKPFQETYKYSTFPKSAQVFVDAIRKNRSCQKLLRSKLIQIEARIEEIQKLKEHVEILKDFQVSCRRRTRQALLQKKDPRVQLISTPKADDKKPSPFGPPENCQVANHKLALEKFPLKLQRNKWKEAEKENLLKGITQLFHEMVLGVSLENFSSSEGDTRCFDDLITSIKDIEISAEEIRIFLPKVNWNLLASRYLPDRSGAECEARWLNCEDPLINHEDWSSDEDKHLLFIIQENGIYNWIDIAVSLGKNRTPFQCLARYQRTYNPCIIKREWTPEEDRQLRLAIETYGESNWQTLASTLEGRTGTQCSNRWKKTLNPERKRVGRWSKDEDKHVIVAASLFGTKNWSTKKWSTKIWSKISQFVQGRTHVQCRERWVNSLDPSLNMNEWTAEEDAKLEAATSEHGYCWSRIASCLPPRTDNQCRRRWKILFPEEVPLLQQAKRIKKLAFISNYVDRESERPLLSPNDFLLLAPPESTLMSAPEHPDSPNKQKRKPRKRPQVLLDEPEGADLPLQQKTKPRKRQRSLPCATSISEPGQKVNEWRQKRRPSVPNKDYSKRPTTRDEDETAPLYPVADAPEVRNINDDRSIIPLEITDARNSSDERTESLLPEICDSPPLNTSEPIICSGDESDCTLAWFIENKMKNTENKLKKLPMRRRSKHRN